MKCVPAWEAACIGMSIGSAVLDLGSILSQKCRPNHFVHADSALFAAAFAVAMRSTAACASVHTSCFFSLFHAPLFSGID
jgi:hypothetical protein